MNNWILNDEEMTEIPSDEKWMGFVYLITNLSTQKKYVGKKLFWFSKTKTVKGKKKRIQAESDWKDYYGSNDDLNEDVGKFGEANFKREILHLCKTKGECNYLEAREQMDRRVLETDEYYNGQIQCRIHQSHVKRLSINE